MNQTTTATRSWTGAALLAGLIGLVGLAGCRGERSDKPPRQFFPDLDDQYKWRPQGGSEFFADGRTMRPAVPGAVAYGTVSVSIPSDAAWASSFRSESAAMVDADPIVATGVDPSVKPDDLTGPQYVERIPIAVDRALLERGRERFGIYCAVCHGLLGDGQGPVGQRWSAPVPSYHDPKYSDPKQKQGRDGYIFETALHGVPNPDGTLRMPGYAHALSERDAWAIVAYIRVLQDARRGTLDQVPASERDALEKQMAAMISAQADADAANVQTPGGQP